jgi:opacity protein-like surface antigen
MRPTACSLLCLALTLGSAASAVGQVRSPPPRSAPQEPYPTIAPRGFVLFSQQKFAAEQTFEAVFDDSVQPFRGGGVDVVVYRNFFAELAFSRFKQTGERVFRAGGETFPVGIPLTATITPFEVSGGYRMTQWRRVLPYAGAGLGSYGYKETSSFAASGEDVDVSKKGFILFAGAEFRVIRWFGISADVHKTSIDDIIGTGGISQEFNETDLGGTAFRVRLMVGR